jgi:hypothetical protein
MWFTGIQRLVYLLQEFQESGTAYNSICRKTALPGGMLYFLSCLLLDNIKLLLFSIFFLAKLMAMNVIPRLVLDDA